MFNFCLFISSSRYVLCAANSQDALATMTCGCSLQFVQSSSGICPGQPPFGIQYCTFICFNCWIYRLVFIFRAFIAVAVFILFISFITFFFVFSTHSHGIWYESLPAMNLCRDFMWFGFSAIYCTHFELFLAVRVLGIQTDMQNVITCSDSVSYNASWSCFSTQS